MKKENNDEGSHIQKIFKTLLVLLAIGGFLTLGWLTIAKFAPNLGSWITKGYPTYPNEQKIIFINYSERWDYWLSLLIWCESRGNPQAIGDSGKARGLFQYHLPTFQMYILKYNLLPNAEKEEIANFILDEEIQTELTKLILLEGGWENWTKCGKMIGLNKVDYKNLK